MVFWVTLATAVYQECPLNVYPLPRNCTTGYPPHSIIIQPCSLIFRIYTPLLLPHLNESLSQYMLKSYSCGNTTILVFNGTILNSSSYTVDIVVIDPLLKSVSTVGEETYMVNVDTTGTVIRGGTYVSSLRGIDTFLQLIIREKEP